MDEVVFDVPTFLEHLPKGIDVGEVLHGAWRIEDAYFGRDDAIQLQISDGRTTFTVLVMPRDDARAAYRRTPHFDIVHLSRRGRDPVMKDVSALAAMQRLASAIAFADRPPRIWRFPPRTARSTEGPAEARPDERVLNLAIDGACNSRCSFCSLSVVHQPESVFDDAYHAQVLGELERARAEGISFVRVNGIEPLTYPRIVEVIAHATAIGFTRARVFTTALPLADRAFAERVVAAMPEGRSIIVPLYGASAEVHEAMTGKPGSFTQILAALENLRALLGPHEVEISTVIMQQNLGEIGGIREIAARHGVGLETHMPYPSLGGRTDPYRTVAPRFSDAVAVMHALEPPVPVMEAPPCVVLRHERATGIPSFTRIRPAQRGAAGNAYRSERYVQSGGPGLVNVAANVRCPEAGSCALAERCTQEIYRAYAELHGLGELSAIRPEELPP
jgi:MoaA/NifB/PqqE/SkfB family radical SAM enzyme